jgi:hypothetical protein
MRSFFFQKLSIDLWIVDAKLFKKTYQPWVDMNQISVLFVMANSTFPQNVPTSTSHNTFVLTDSV